VVHGAGGGPVIVVSRGRDLSPPYPQLLRIAASRSPRRVIAHGTFLHQPTHHQDKLLSSHCTELHTIPRVPT